MSVFNLTFSYAKPYLQIAGRDDLSFRKKKMLLKNALFAFIALISLYLYLTGAIVSQNLKRNNLEVLFNKISLENNHTESAFILESAGKSAEYFLAGGYEEPKNLDTIKRASNVAFK